MKLKLESFNGVPTNENDATSNKLHLVSFNEGTQQPQIQQTQQVEVPSNKGILARGASAIGNSVFGGAKQFVADQGTSMASAYAKGQNARNTMMQDYANDSAYAYNRAEKDLQMMLEDNANVPNTWSDADVESQKRMVADLKIKNDALNNPNIQNIQQGAVNESINSMGEVNQSANKNIETAKANLGNTWLGDRVADALASTTQVTLDALTNKALGIKLSPEQVGVKVAEKGAKLTAKDLLGNFAKRTASNAMTMGSFASRAYGGAVQNAINQGATLEDAQDYAVAVATIEIATEMISNIPSLQKSAYGEGMLDDRMTEIFTNLTTKLTKTEVGKNVATKVAKVIANGVGEGLEEVIADWLEWQLPRMYGGDVDKATDVLIGNLDSFVTGAISGLMGDSVGNVANTINTTAQDYATGSQIKQRGVAQEVVDQANALESGISKEKAQGKTGENISKLRLGMIARNLQTDTAKQSVSNVAKEQGIEDENTIEALKKLAVGEELTAKDKELLDIQDTTDKTSNSIIEKATENYNKIAKEQNEKYKSTLNKIAKEEVEKVNSAENGLFKNEASKRLKSREARLMDLVAKKLNKKIIYSDNIEVGDNGKYDENGNIWISSKSQNPLGVVFAHEVAHDLKVKQPELFNELQKQVESAEGNQKQTILEVLNKSYNSDIAEENVAHFIENLQVDISEFEKLVGINRNLATKIYDFVKDIFNNSSVGWNKGLGEGGVSKELYSLVEDKAQVKDTFLKAMEKALNNETNKVYRNSDFKYSKELLPDGTQYIKLDGDYFTNPDGTKMSERQAYKILVGNEIELPDGDVIGFIGKYTNGTKGYDELFRKYPHYQEGIDIKKINEAINKNIVETLSVSTKTKSNVQDYKLKHANMGINSFDERSVIVADDNNAYNLSLTIANMSNGKKIAYAKEYISINDEVLKKIKKEQSGVKSSTIEPSNSNINHNIKNVNIYSLSKINDKFKSALEKGDNGTAQKLLYEYGKLKGYDIKAYHGTARADRVGNVFREDRATSGPMAFFTDNRQIAENYARDKKDTSIAYDDNYSDYETQFRVKGKGIDIPIHKAWYKIPFVKHEALTDKAKHIRLDLDTEDAKLIYDPNSNDAGGGFNNQLKYANGNTIRALEEQWLYSGNIFGEEQRFLDVLNMAGITKELENLGYSVDYLNPDYREEKVYDVLLKIKKPFDTENANDKFIKSFEKWAKENNTSSKETANADMWDKNGVTDKIFVDRLKEDIKNGTTHAWTSIPDFVTDYLKSLGYDGIKDKGGKHGGVGHTVWIPFQSNQIKSADINTKDDSGNVIPLTERFNDNKVDIRYSKILEPLTKKEFMKKYPYAHKLNLRKENNIEEQISSIMREGFKGTGGFGTNLIVADDNASAERWSGVSKKKGDYFLLVPKDQADTRNGYFRIKPGYKPTEDAIVQASYDNEPLFEMYNDKNARYSKALDSQGNELSKGQQEYFKNSKVRDDKGNLMPMYHGTRTFGFTVFDAKNSDDRTSLFFTNRPEVSQSYIDKKSNIEKLSKDKEDSRVENFTSLNTEKEIFDYFNKEGSNINFGKPSKEEAKAELDTYFDDFTKDLDELKTIFNKASIVFDDHDWDRVKTYSMKPKIAKVEEIMKEVLTCGWNSTYKSNVKEADKEKVGNFIDKYEKKILNDKLRVLENIYSGESKYFEYIVNKDMYYEVDNLRELKYEAYDINPNKSTGIYEVYLNIENPFEIDAQGLDWSSLDYETLKPMDSSDEYSYNGKFPTLQWGNEDKALYVAMVMPTSYLYEDETTIASIESWVGKKKWDSNGKNIRGAFGEETSKYVKEGRYIPAIMEGEKLVLDDSFKSKVEEYWSDKKIDWDKLTEQINKKIKWKDSLRPTIITKGTSDSNRWEGNNTRAISRWAKENGYDGVIFRNIRDSGGLTPFYGKSDIAVAFNSNQVKSTANKEPTKENPDIRYSKQLDTEYMDAVNKGDTETAQKLVDRVAKEKGYTIKAYHGTWKPLNKDGTKPFTVFDIGKNYGAYFSKSKELSNGFTELFEKKGSLYSAYLKLKNPFVIDAEGLSWNKIKTPKEMLSQGYGEESFTDEIVSYSAGTKKYDGVVIENIKEGDGKTITTDYIVFNPNQIKSADAITYDDNGNVIPLSERFNESNNDIRWSKSLNDERVYEKLQLENNLIAEGHLKAMALSPERFEENLGRNSARAVNDYARGYIVWVKPMDFLKATTPNKTELQHIFDQSHELNMDELKAEIQTPTLWIDIKDGTIQSHEGRHRMASLYNAGYDRVAVLLADTTYKYGAKPISYLNLKGQVWNEEKNKDIFTRGFTIENALPLSNEYADKVKQYYVDVPNTSKYSKTLNYVESAKFNGKPFWSGSVNLTDGVIEEVHSYKEAKNADFHHSLYFTQEQADKIDNNENGFFWVDDGKINGMWREEVPQNIISKIKEQIEIIPNVKNSKELNLTEEDINNLYSAKVETSEAKLRDQAIDNAYASVKSLIEDLKQQVSEGTVQSQDYKSIEDAYKEVIKLEKQKAKDDQKLKDMDKAERKEYQDFWKKELDKADAKLDKEVAKLKAKEIVDKYQEQIKNARERRKRSQESQQLLRALKQLKAMRNKVNPNFQAQIDDIIGDINLFGTNVLKNGYVKNDGTFVRGEIDLQNLLDRLEEREKDNNFINDKSYKEYKEWVSRFNKRQIGNMPLEDIERLLESATALRHQILTYNQTVGETQDREMYAIAKSVASEVESSKKRKIGNLTNFSIDTLRPKTFFKQLGGFSNGALEGMYQELENGQTKYIDYVMKSTKPFDDFVERNPEAKKWGGRDADLIEVQLGDRKLKINKMMRISLYMHLQNDDNMKHIVNGGIVVPDMKLYNEGKIKDAYDRGVTVKATKEILKDLVGYMSPKELEFADLMKKHFKNASVEINNTSMALDGYEKATVENYYPIQSDKSYLKSNFDSIVRDFRLENTGSLKAREGGANPIILEDANNVLTRQIETMGRYVGFAVPLRNFKRMYDFHIDGESINRKISRQSTQYGNYIEHLIAQINGNNGKTSDFSKFSGNYASAVLNFNPSVALSQTASYPTAMAVLGEKALRKGLTMGKVDTEIMAKYTPLYWYRTKGYIDNSLSAVKNASSWIQKLPGTKWIQAMDLLTTRTLWNASQAWVQDNTDLKQGTDAYWQKVAEMYNRTIYDTQPNYTVMQRPEVLRSDSELVRQLFMFKTQSYQNYNMLYESLGEMIAKKGTAQEGQARKQAFVTASTLLIANAVFTAFKNLVKMARNKKDEDWFDEDGDLRILKWLMDNYFSNALGSIPLGSEVFEAINFNNASYDTFTIPAVEVINSMISAYQVFESDIVKAISSGSPIVYFRQNRAKMMKDIWSLSKKISQFAGIPLDNVAKYIGGMVSWFMPEVTKAINNTINPVKKNDIAFSYEFDLLMKNELGFTNDKLYNLYQKAGDMVLPSFDVSNSSYGLTITQQYDVKEDYKKNVKSIFNTMFNMQGFKSLNSDQQAHCVVNAYSYAKEMALSKVNKDYPKTKWIKEAKSSPSSYIINKNKTYKK